MRDLGPVPPPLPGSEAPVTGGLRERKKRLMRQQLSDTATRMFLERGFDAVKVTEIAEACGVSEKTVFNYFPTRRFGALIWQTPSLRAYQSDTMDQATAMVAGILAGRSGLRPDDPEPQIAAAALLGLWRIQYRALPRYLDGTRTPAEVHQQVTADVHRAGHLISSGLDSFPARTRNALPAPGPVS